MSSWIWFTGIGIVCEVAAISMIIAGITLPENCYYSTSGWTVLHCDSSSNAALLSCGILILVIGVIMLIGARKLRVQVNRRSTTQRRQMVQYLTPEQTIVRQQQEQLRYFPTDTEYGTAVPPPSYPNLVPSNRSNSNNYRPELQLAYSNPVYDGPPPPYEPNK